MTFEYKQTIVTAVNAGFAFARVKPLPNSLHFSVIRVAKSRQKALGKQQANAESGLVGLSDLVCWVTLTADDAPERNLSPTCYGRDRVFHEHKRSIACVTALIRHDAAVAAYFA